MSSRRFTLSLALACRYTAKTSAASAPTTTTMIALGFAVRATPSPMLAVSATPAGTAQRIAMKAKTWL
jgi:hypothetical protein